MAWKPTLTRIAALEEQWRSGRSSPAKDQNGQDKIIQRTMRWREQEQEQKEAVAAGKKPFFAKRAARREEHARATFEAMKEGGNLKRYMKKRQKKLSHQDRRRMRG